MKKTIFAAAVMAAVAGPAMAGGLLTNTNQHVAFLRNPARDAAIGIDGVYSNPAGVAFLPKGFHLAINWQAAIQKRQITSTAPFYQFNTENRNPTHHFEGSTSAPVIPSLQLAYVFNDKWSISTQFAVGGGGGTCEFGRGLPMFEQLLGGTLASGINTATRPGEQAYSYSMNQFINGKQYFYSIQVGGTYKINEHISVFGGLRTVLANCGYDGAVTDFKVNGIPGATYSPVFAQKAREAAAVAEQFAQAGDMANAQKYAAIAKQAGTVALMTQSDLVLDVQQRGFGYTPIIGVDVNLGKLNLAAKYEFRTKMDLKNNSSNSENVETGFADYADNKHVRYDIPAMLAVGAQYSIIDKVRAMAGFHYYFDKDAKGNPTNVEKNTWEVTLGAEWDVNDWLTVSIGGQKTKYDFGERIQDTNFNISSNALSFGATFSLSSTIKINAGYMHTFYGDTEINRGNGIKDYYTRKNDVLGVGIDLKF